MQKGFNLFAPHYYQSKNQSSVYSNRITIGIFLILKRQSLCKCSKKYISLAVYVQILDIWFLLFYIGIQWELWKIDIFNLPHEGMLQFYCNLMENPLAWSIFRKHLHRIDISRIVDFPHWPLCKLGGRVSQVTFSRNGHFSARKLWPF